jgi:hypothetical protein
MIDLSNDDQRRYYLIGYLYGREGKELPEAYQSASGEDLGVAAKFGYLDAKEKRPSRVTLPGSDASPSPSPSQSPPKPAPSKVSPKPAADKQPSSPTWDAINRPGDNRVKPESEHDRNAYRDGFDGSERTAFASAIEKAWYEAGKLDRAGKQSARAERPVSPGSDWTWPVIGAGTVTVLALVMVLGRKRRR